MIDILEATFKDLALIRQLAEQTFHFTYLPLQPKEKVDYLFDIMYSTNSLSNQMKNGQRFVLAKDSGYLGFASYEINCKDTGQTKIHKLYVLPSAQGKGVGKNLIDFIGEVALHHKNHTLSLNVFRQNPAIDFYEKIGFRKIGAEDIDVGNGFTMNDFVMEKELNA